MKALTAAVPVVLGMAFFSAPVLAACPYDPTA